MNLNYRLTLASKSPRRQELLSKLDLEFEVQVKSIDESYPPDLPKEKIAEYLAVEKSNAFGDIQTNELIITSDTTVVLGDSLLEKAKDASEAAAMLKKLSGQSHLVITGVCLKSKGKQISFSESTEVTFADLSDEQINYYIETYQPFDKAGAYGIQEWIGMVGVKGIKGDFYNVMGLPLFRLYRELKKFQ